MNELDPQDFFAKLDSFLTENVDPLIAKVREFNDQFDECELHRGVFLTVIPTMITNLLGWRKLSIEDREDVMKEIRETLDAHINIPRPAVH